MDLSAAGDLGFCYTLRIGKVDLFVVLGHIDTPDTAKSFKGRNTASSTGECTVQVGLLDHIFKISLGFVGLLRVFIHMVLQ